MANSVTHGGLPYPIRKARFSLAATWRVSAGTPTDPTTPDTEFSIDGGASFSDTAEEVTTGGSNGAGYLTLTGAETDNPILIIAAKSANCLTTPAILYPRSLAIVGSGTLSAGSSTGGTLGTLLAYDVTGCFVRTTGGTGGGGTGGANNQARKILTYDTTTGAFTCDTWGTTPDNTTTYDVLLPEGVTLGMLRALNPTTFGRTLDVSTGGEAGVDWANVGTPGATVGLSGTTVKTATDVETDTADIQTRIPAALSSGNMKCDVLALSGDTAAADNAESFFDGTGYAGTNNVIPTVTLVNTLTTYTGNTPQTGDSYAIVNHGTYGNSAIRTIVAAIQTVLAGITSLASWLGALAGKTADASTQTEIRATTAGAGYTITTDSLEALRDRGDTAWITATSVTVSDKTGFKLASDGLALVTTWTVDITGSLSGSVGSISGVTFPTNFAALGINVSGHISRVVLVDTTTTNTDLVAVASNVSLILADTGTDGVVLSSSTQQSIATTLLDLASAVDGKTPRQTLRYVAAALSGKISGAGTGTEKAYGLDGSTERVRYTVDVDGNRTAVSYDP